MHPSDSTPVGHRGRLTATGGIRPGGLGEAMVAIRGGVEAFLARDVDGGEIPPYAEVIVVDYVPPRTVLVTPAPDPTTPPEEASPWTRP